MRIEQTAYEVYTRSDGRSLACYVHEGYGDKPWRAVMVESKRSEYVEDPIRLAHWPAGTENSQHRSFAAAIAHVEKTARAWKRATGPRKERSSCRGGIPI